MSGPASSGFGFSVAISGRTAVVGSPYENYPIGAAYIFTWSGSAWVQQARLAPAATRGNFGLSVGISGSTVVVGAPYSTVNGVLNVGAAYVFVESGGVWSQQAKLTASDGVGGDQFGDSVAVSGDRAIVGADYRNSKTGAAYVFARSGTTWSQEQGFVPSNAASGDQFGYSVAISGATAVVGSPFHGSHAGAVYILVESNGTWAVQQAVYGTGVETVGLSVAISGDTALLGAYYYGFVVVRSGVTWSSQATLTAPSSTSYFGTSVGIAGDTAVIGDGGDSSNKGAAYAFFRSGSTWSSGAKLTASDGATDNRFGGAVGVSDAAVVVGASYKNAAYIFVPPPTVAGYSAPPVLRKSPFTVTFNRAVMGISADDFTVIEVGPIPVDGTISCMDPSNAPVDCSTGPVLIAQLVPSKALWAGEYYFMNVNPSSLGVVGYPKACRWPPGRDTSAPRGSSERPSTP